MTDVALKVQLKIGPATIEYEAPADAKLFHITQAEFIQMVMDLMDYVGTDEDPPDPPEVDIPYVPTTPYIPPYQPQPIGPIWNEPSLQPYYGTSTNTNEIKMEGTGSDGDSAFAEFAEEEPEGEPTGGTVVGRVAPVQEVKMS